MKGANAYTNGIEHFCISFGSISKAIQSFSAGAKKGGLLILQVKGHCQNIMRKEVIRYGNQMVILVVEPKMVDLTKSFAEGQTTSSENDCDKVKPGCKTWT